MEDERGPGVHDGDGPPLSSKLVGESVVENMGNDNQVAEVFGEGDGEEIMVEVVGSDVYVDGISGNGEGDIEMGEVGDLEGGVVDKHEESTDVSREGDGKKMEEGGVVEKKEESTNVSREDDEKKVEKNEESTDGSREGDGNKMGEGGAVEKNEESKDVSREGNGNKMEEGGLGSSESRDEKHGKIDINLSNSVGVDGEKVSALPVGGVSGVDDEEWNPGIKGTDGSSAEVSSASPMEICEEEKTKDDAVDKDSSEIVSAESSDHPVEAVLDEKSDLAEEKEVLPSNDNSTSYDDVAAASVKSHEETEETHDGNDGNQKDGEETKCPSTDGDLGVREKSVSEKDVCATESENSVPKTDAQVSEVPDESKNCSDEVHVAELEPKDQTDGASHADPESIHENALESREGKSGGKDEASKSEGYLETHKAENDVSSATPVELADGGDTTEVNKDKCLDVEVKDGAEEIEKSDPGIDSDQPVNAKTVGAEKGDHNVVISPTEVVDGVGSGAEGKKIDSENLGKSLAGYGDAEIPSQNDSGENLHLPKEGAHAEVADSGVSGEKGEEIDSEILGKSSTVQGDAEISAEDDTAENIHHQEESTVETAVVMVTEDTKQVVDLQITETSNHEAEDTDMVPNEVSSVAADSDITSEKFVVEECGSPQSTKQEVALQVMETSNHEAEDTNIVPNEVTHAAADSDTAQVSVVPEGTGNAESLVSSTDISLLDGGAVKEADEMLIESNGFHVLEAPEGHTSEAKPMDVEEERESDQIGHDGLEVDTDLASEGPSSESDKSKISNEVLFNYAGCLRMKQSGYLPPPENEGCFAPSDLVWGKVRSHPWWPGQIFDPADASEKAVKYHKKDSYLVAYFGDQTFAWNDSSALKPFRSYFSQIQKQSNSESFHNAVSCALEEIERRVQLGLSCSCMPKDEYARIEAQVVENTGIREESSQRSGVDRSSCASCFEPNELLEFIKGVAPRASSGADGLDLVIARAQLSAFCCFKGYRAPPEFPAPGELLEIDGEISNDAAASRKHRPKEGAQSRKERSMMELMGDGEYYPDAEDDEPVAGKKRKALDPLAEGSDKRVSFSAAKAPTPTTQAPKPSFKIGECIRRVASQLTGVKGSNEEMVVDGSPSVYEPSEKVSAESLSVNELLSQLELVAQDPKKRNNLQSDIRSFFMRFRSSTALSRRGRKKRSEQAVGGSGEEFEFDDVNDSYWTDRIVQNYSAEQLLHERMNGSASLQLVAFGAEKPAKAGRKSHSRKRFSSGNSPTSAPEFDESAKRMKQETSPAELILNFAERNCIPSEINLNKMFRRFGPLMESETEVDHEAGSAKVIFKRGSDAEVARNSAEKFSIFGPVLVNYQIGYSPVISVRISPITLSQPPEEATMVM